MNKVDPLHIGKEIKHKAGLNFDLGSLEDDATKSIISKNKKR